MNNPSCRDHLPGSPPGLSHPPGATADGKARHGNTIDASRAVTRQRPFSFVTQRLLPALAIASVIAIAVLVLTGVHPELASDPPPPHDLTVSGATIAPTADGVLRVTSLRGDGAGARAGLHVGDGVSVEHGMRIVRFRRQP